MLFFLIVGTFIGTTILGMEESSPFINEYKVNLAALMSQMTQGIIIEPKDYEEMRKNNKYLIILSYKEFLAAHAFAEETLQFAHDEFSRNSAQDFINLIYNNDIPKTLSELLLSKAYKPEKITLVNQIVVRFAEKSNMDIEQIYSELRSRIFQNRTKLIQAFGAKDNISRSLYDVMKNNSNLVPWHLNQISSENLKL